MVDLEREAVHASINPMGLRWAVVRRASLHVRPPAVMDGLSFLPRQSVLSMPACLDANHGMLVEALGNSLRFVALLQVFKLCVPVNSRNRLYVRLGEFGALFGSCRVILLLFK